MQYAIKKTSDIHVRWMIRRDIPEVLATERGSFEHPWEEEDFLKCLRQRSTIGQVAELKTDGCPVIGYMIYELQLCSLYLVRLAVHPDHRLQGVGRAMLAMLARKLSQPARRVAEADIPDDALHVHLWLKACGWRGVSVDHVAEEIRFEKRTADGIEWSGVE